MKPVFLFGNGLRNNPELVEALCKLNVPVLTTWQAADLIPEDSPVFCGRPGVLGQRAANIIQQKSNWLMVVGARLDMEQVGHNLDNFAPHAHKTVVDIDAAELEKYPKDWSRYLMDLNNPLDERYGSRGLPFVAAEAGNAWLSWCKALYNNLRYELDGTDTGEGVDPYSFMRVLADACVEGEVIVPGSSGMQSCAFYQSFKFRKNQRALVCNTIGAMGMEPIAIGAAVATGKRVVVITGDGGFAQNVQELEVVKRLSLPIHYFVFNNGGYGSIATMQDGRFGLRVGSTPDSGFTLPSLHRIAKVWDMPHFGINSNRELFKINRILSLPTATITSVAAPISFNYVYKVASRMEGGVLIPDPMEDMTPKLPNLAEVMNELMD